MSPKITKRFFDAASAETKQVSIPRIRAIRNNNSWYTQVASTTTQTLLYPSSFALPANQVSRRSISSVRFEMHRWCLLPSTRPISYSFCRSAGPHFHLRVGPGDQNPRVARLLSPEFQLLGCQCSISVIY